MHDTCIIQKKDLTKNTYLLQEAAQGLMKQLHELRAKEKELMRKKKQDKKPKLQPTTMVDSQSSSESSSESSDNEPKEVIPINRFTTEAIPVAPLLPAQQFNATAIDAFLHNTSSHRQKQYSQLIYMDQPHIHNQSTDQFPLHLPPHGIESDYSHDWRQIPRRELES